MPTAWYGPVPYKREIDRDPSGVRALQQRYCAMDDLTNEIRAVGGDWSESEVDNDQALVLVRGTSAVLASIGLLYPQLNETQARLLWTPTRKTPAWDATTQQIIFRATERARCKPLDLLVSTIPAVGLSGDVLALLGLWSAVGFGQGWRIPAWLALWMATQGIVPGMVLEQIAKVLFDQWGALFPTTGVLDNFNRTENPLSDGGNWTNNLLAIGNLQTDGTGCTIASGTGGSAYRSNVTYGPDSEVFFTQTANPDDTAGQLTQFVRLAAIGTGTTDGYDNDCPRERVAGDEWRPHRLDNDVETLLTATVLQEVANGDLCGLEMIGPTLGLYYQPSGGSWSLLATRSDTTYTAAGNLGLSLNGTSPTYPIIDDCGGGTVVPANAGLAPFELDEALYVGLHGKY